MFLVDLFFDDLEDSTESKAKKNSGVNIKKYSAFGKDTAQNVSLLIGGVGKGKKISATELAKTVERIAPHEDVKINTNLKGEVL